MNQIPVYVVFPCPGAPAIGEKADAPTVRWESICNIKTRYVFINHEPCRNPSRWTYAENKRPFVVYDKGWNKLGASSTLPGALKIARREADRIAQYIANRKQA